MDTVSGQNKVEIELRAQVATLTGLLHKISSSLDIDIIGCQGNVLSVSARNRKETLVGVLTYNEQEIVEELRNLRFADYNIPNSEFRMVAKSEDEAGKIAAAMEIEAFFSGLFCETLYFVYREGIQKRFVHAEPASTPSPSCEDDDSDDE